MSANWKPWMLATRPKTLTASVIPVLVGTALAANERGWVSWEISVYALIVALFITIGTNLVNDALDFKKGADTAERLGPVRVTQSGLLRINQVLSGGMLCFGAAFLFSIPLIITGGWPIALIMVLSILSGYFYTGGAFPLSYLGLGDLFVLIFFGFIATSAVCYLQGGSVGFQSFLAGAEVGLLSTLLIAINNLRDVVTDAKANKKTLPVRFGIFFGKSEISTLIVLPFILNLLWFSEGYWLAGSLPFFTIPIGVFLIRAVWVHDPGKIYNKFLALAALLHLLFGFLLTVGLFAE